MVTKADIKACIGKTRWASEKSARYALQAIRARSDNRMPSTVRPYRCPACRSWHLGHEV